MASSIEIDIFFGYTNTSRQEAIHLRKFLVSHEIHMEIIIKMQSQNAASNWSEEIKKETDR